MRCFTVAGRVVRQIVKDRRSLALLFIAPILVIYLLFIVLNTGAERPRIQAFGLPSDLQAAIGEEAEVTAAKSCEDAMAMLADRKTDAVVLYEEPTVTVYVEGSQSAVTASVRKALAAAVSAYSKERAAEEMQAELKTQMEALLGQVQAQLGSQGANIQIDIPGDTPDIALTEVQYSYLTGAEDMTAFDSIAPLMMGFFIFFFVFLLAGVAFLRERVSGTLERLLATPVRRFQIVLGYFLGFGLFVFLQTFLIQLYMVKGLQVELKGDFLLVMLINLLLAAGSLSLGTLLSAFARNELQMFQFIPLVIVPQILFCGLFSLHGAPDWVIVLSKIFPLTYAADALTDVALRGLGFADILPDLLILSGYMALFLILNTLVLKKYRRL